MILLLIILGVILIIKIRRYILDTQIKIRDNNVIGFFGGLGTGKTFLSVLLARKKLKYVRKHINSEAQLYSNIPIRISRNEYSCILTNDILMLQKAIPKGSICMIDELGQYLSQFNFKANNIDNVEEFMRLYRHYTQGGFLIVNDQSISNVELHFRRRINIMYELIELKGFLLHIRVEAKEMINTEDTFTMVKGDEERYIRMWKPLTRLYDTYVYSDRYLIEKKDIYRWWKMKTNYILKIPKEDYYSKTLKKDEDYPYTTKKDKVNES